MRRTAPLLAITLLAGCVGVSKPAPVGGSRPATPPPMTGTVAAPSSQGFIAPTVMRLPGLERVIGADARRLSEILGAPRLTIHEGDAVKLQYAGSACVLDIYLYPLRPGSLPAATHVEARRQSDGKDVDRAACVAALER